MITTLVAFLAGEVAIFALGVGWLSTFTGAGKAVALGVTPFLLAEALKVALACALLPFAWKQAAK